MPEQNRPGSSPGAEPSENEEQLGPRVSAVLVGFNQGPQLRRAIEALERSQDRERLEILVVDCGSQDESPRLDAEYPSINMLRLPHHFGATKARNVASRTAKTDLLFFVSPEVEVQPDTVSRLAEKLDEEADTTAAVPLLVDREGRQVPVYRPLPSSSNLYPAPADVDVTQESVTVGYPGLDAVMVRKQFVRGMNYFDERFGNSWSDADLAAQIRRGGKKIRVYPAIRAVLDEETNPLQGDVLAQADETLGAAAYLGKYYGFFSGFSFRLMAILKALATFNVRLLGYLISGQKLDGSQSA